MSRPWADQPNALITTTPFSDDSSHSAYYIATQMALAHNGIIRGLNAIYLQSPHLPPSNSNPATTRDFLAYCQCWCEELHHHHSAEEATFFPQIEEVTGVKGLMEHNVEQHHAFAPGFEAFWGYVKGVRAEEYDAGRLRGLVEGFQGGLVRHLHEEIETLRALDRYDSEGLRGAYRRFERELMSSDKFRIPPLIFGTADRSFEGGKHNFPAVPFFVPFVIQYLFSLKLHGAWRFNPCTFWRDRRELAFLGESSKA